MEKQHIITAIENLNIFLKVNELKGSVPYRENGSLFRFSGGFNMVFKLIKGNEKWAFRVWHVSLKDTKRRFELTSKYLEKKNLPYFSKFIYDEKGLVVNGEFLDTVRMEWLEGKLLKDYLEENLHSKTTLLRLAKDFLMMCVDLHENEISHGDLQHGNMLIQEQGRIRLIDYDSICIPELEGEKDLVTGLKGYQHPSRSSIGNASLKSDYFSQLVIYLTVVVLAERPDLWDKYNMKDTEHLLFSEHDLNDIESSEVYQDLKGMSSKVDLLLRVLVDYLRESSYLNLKPLKSYIDKRVKEVKNRIIIIINEQRKNKGLFTSSKKVKQKILEEIKFIDTQGLPINKEAIIEKQWSDLNTFYSIYKDNANTITEDRLPEGFDSVQNGQSFINVIKKREKQKRVVGYSGGGVAAGIILLISSLGIFYADSGDRFTDGNGQEKQEEMISSEIQVLMDIDYNKDLDSFEGLFNAVIDKKHNDIFIDTMITHVAKKMDGWKVQLDLTYNNGVKTNSKITLESFLSSLQGERANSISTIKTMKILNTNTSSKIINVRIVKK